jgi:hypothetical protein
VEEGGGTIVNGDTEANVMDHFANMRNLNINWFRFLVVVFAVDCVEYATA